MSRLRNFLRAANEKRHRLAHLLRLNFRRTIYVDAGFHGMLLDVQEECCSCKHRNRLDLLAVPGKGNITFFSRKGRDEGSTYDTWDPSDPNDRPIPRRGPY